MLSSVFENNDLRTKVYDIYKKLSDPIVVYRFFEIFFSTFPPINITIFICSTISLKKKNSF